MDAPSVENAVGFVGRLQGKSVAGGGGVGIKDKEEISAHWQGTHFSNIKANGGTLK